MIGITKAGRVIRWRSIVSERNAILYTVTVRHDLAVSDAVKADVAAILESFRYLDSR